MDPIDDNGQFVFGIYNYCDRWCERCTHTRKCYLFSQEQQFMEREVLAGNDPNSAQSALRLVEHSLGKAVALLTQVAAAAVSQRNAVPPNTMRPTRSPHPLYIQAGVWSRRLDFYVRRVHRDLPDVAEEIGGRFRRTYTGCRDERDLAAAGMRAEEELARFKDALAVIGQYRFLVPQKTARVTIWLASENGKQKSRDAIGSAKLVYECLGKVTSALWVTGEFHRPWLEDALSLAAGSEALRRALDEILPEHRTFVRPGLDDDPHV